MVLKIWCHIMLLALHNSIGALWVGYTARFEWILAMTPFWLKSIHEDCYGSYCDLFIFCVLISALLFSIVDTLSCWKSTFFPPHFLESFSTFNLKKTWFSYKIKFFYLQNSSSTYFKVNFSTYFTFFWHNNCWIKSEIFNNVLLIDIIKNICILKFFPCCKLVHPIKIVVRFIIPVTLHDRNSKLWSSAESCQWCGTAKKNFS